MRRAPRHLKRHRDHHRQGTDVFDESGEDGDCRHQNNYLPLNRGDLGRNSVEGGPYKPRALDRRTDHQGTRDNDHKFGRSCYWQV